MSLRRVWIGTHFPCHPKRKVRFLVFPDVPYQQFDRTCPACGTEWGIDLTMLRESGGMMIHKAEWVR